MPTVAAQGFAQRERSRREMPWRFIDDLPAIAPAHRAASSGDAPGNGFVLFYLIWKLGDLELEIADLELAADAVAEQLALQRLTATRARLADAADEILDRRLGRLQRGRSTRSSAALRAPGDRRAGRRPCAPPPASATRR